MGDTVLRAPGPPHHPRGSVPRMPFAGPHRRVGPLVLALLCSTVPGRLLAQPTRPADPFEVAPLGDGLLLGAGTVLWLTPEFVARGHVRPVCDPCDPDALAGLDRYAVGRYSAFWDAWGDWTVALLPVASVAGAFLARTEGRDLSGLLTDAALVGEALVLTGLLHQLVRFSVRRPRPFMYAEEARPELREQPTATLSFFSGHTAVAFAAASSLAYLASERRSGWPAWLLWSVPMALAASVGLARVQAGEHFPTDVLVGAVVGSAIGVLVPWTHRRAP